MAVVAGDSSFKYFDYKTLNTKTTLLYLVLKCGFSSLLLKKETSLVTTVVCTFSILQLSFSLQFVYSSGGLGEK